MRPFFAPHIFMTHSSPLYFSLPLQYQYYFLPLISLHMIFSSPKFFYRYALYPIWFPVISDPSLERKKTQTLIITLSLTINIILTQIGKFILKVNYTVARAVFCFCKIQPVLVKPVWLKAVLSNKAFRLLIYYSSVLVSHVCHNLR